MKYSIVSLTAVTLLSGNVTAQQKPNIILFLVDDMGWQDTSLPFWKDTTELNRIYETPNMERLAKKGVMFTHAYACPISSPSRVSLFTGANAVQHKVTNWTLKKDTPTDRKNNTLEFEAWNYNGLCPEPGLKHSFYAKCLPQLLRENGYTTMMVGKAHFGSMDTPAANPLTIGFDYNIAGHAAGAMGSYLGEEGYGAEASPERAAIWAVPDLEKYHGTDTFLTEALTLEAEGLMDKALVQSKPFFLYMSHYAVHAPFGTDKRFYQKYVNKGLEHKEAQYAALLEGMDKSLGDLMDYVDRKGIADNTVIIFMSDNGGYTIGRPDKNFPLSEGKGSLKEGGIREPMIVCYPNVAKPSTVNDTPIIIEDFFPTLLELAGVHSYRTPQHIDGRSFLPQVKGRVGEKERALFFHYPNNWGERRQTIGAPQSAVVKGDWKLIHYYESGSNSLYNLKDDISEKNDLSAGYPDKVKELAKVLSDYLRARHATMPILKATGKTVPYPDSCRMQETDTVYVKETQVPVLLERQDNVLFYLRVEAKEAQVLDEVTLRFAGNTDLRNIKSVKLYYGGTEAIQDYGKKRFAPISYLSFTVPGKTLAANRSYSILKSRVDNPKNRKVTLKGGQKLFPGVNYFWVSLQMNPRTSLTDKVCAEIASVTLDGTPADLCVASSQGIEHRMAVGVRHAGDDGVEAYRIPGLITTNKSTLLGVYDVRYNTSTDLQEHVDVGLSRSTDGGRTWEKMRLPLSFGETGGLPAAQNGVGDPSILVDTKTNTVWIVAAWAHGMGNQRAWISSHPGMDMNRTAQLMLTKSMDDGKTWSEPVNITQQVKDPSWRFLLQGPGRGITMRDGTLVFPVQFIDSMRVPNAGIMYSKDCGETWRLHNLARTNTTEAQVAETEPGTLMLNMRDNRKGSRAVAITKNLGRTWKEHVSSRKALQEPVCMASLISVAAEDNVLKKDILIFSNPNTTKGRHHTTIKISLDGGITWQPEHQLLLDEENNWGYSCLTMVDKETIGILYESSTSQITFQVVKLRDIVKE